MDAERSRRCRTARMPLLAAPAHPQLGVGTSKLQADMVSAGGYASIVNTDISTVAVSHMAALHKALPQLSYRVGDVR